MFPHFLLATKVDISLLLPYNVGMGENLQILNSPDFRVADLTIGEVEAMLKDFKAELELALDVIKRWFTPMVAFYSEGSGLENFELVVPEFLVAAGLLGEKPCWVEDENGQRVIGWKPHKPE